MNVLYGVVSVLVGLFSLNLADPAGVPVLALAAGVAGLVRESRQLKRVTVYVLCAVGCLISAAGTVIAVSVRMR